MGRRHVTRASASDGVPVHLGRGRHAQDNSRHPAVKVVAAICAVMLVAVVAFSIVQILRLQGNLATLPLNLDPNHSGSAPDFNNEPMQILVLGTDTRTGVDSRFGDPSDTTEGGNSDVMMLVQISADRERVTVVSLPRDLMVDIPECRNPETGQTFPEQDPGQLNGALGSGGPGCTVAAVNKFTGLDIDHFMMADFNAVTELSRTVGGVDVCVNEPINDPDSGLKLPAGVSSVEGEQALAFLRTRHGFGNGGDVTRIRAQQSFLASLFRKIKDEGTLADIPRLYSIGETVTKNLTVDSGLSNIQDLIGLANRLRDIDLSNVTFVTVPNEEWSLDPNRLQLKEPEASMLFEALDRDEDVRDIPPAPSPTASPTVPDGTTAQGEVASPGAFPTDTPDQTDPTESAETSTPTLSPEEEAAIEAQTEAVRTATPVTVRNLTSTSGRDTTIAQVLKDAGYTNSVTDRSSSRRPSTQIFFGPGYLEQAQDIAEKLGVSEVQVVAQSSLVGVRVDIGADFTEGEKLEPASDLGGLSGQTADQVTCQSSFAN